jgi:predicted DNA-binding protein (UPF0251 family)
MARPKFPRKIREIPPSAVFKPQGIPASALEQVVLAVDEFEAIRLADYEGLYQQEAAENMNISRQTFGRILESARMKTADALIHGKVLKIEGGNIEMPETRTFKCKDCRHEWELPFGTGRPVRCPACGCEDFQQPDSSCSCRRRRGSSFADNGDKPGKGQ